MLRVEQKVELVMTSQELFLPPTHDRSNEVPFMSPEEIRTAIIEPFNALIKRQRLEAAKKERDKELTLAPTLSKRSKIIAERKLIE